MFQPAQITASDNLKFLLIKFKENMAADGSFVRSKKMEPFSVS